MKKIVKGLYMSLGMFCAIPLPVPFWDDDLTNLLLPCFPVVGMTIGGFWWAITKRMIAAGIPVIIAAAVVAVFPFLLTGFFHLDGFMDTSDAILSRRPQEEKIRILKDPHTGSFAVIMFGILIVFQFAAAYVLIEEGKNILLLFFIPIVSRCCSALSMLCLNAMPQSGYTKMFQKNSGSLHKATILCIGFLTIGVSFLLVGAKEFIAVLAVMIGFFAALAYSYREFKGISGDLSGFSLVIGELCGLLVLAII